MRITRDNAFVMVIDIQEKLFPHIEEHGKLQSNLTKLFQGLKLLSVPFVINEQYKKGLGETISPLKNILGDIQSFEKVTFSCCQNEPTLKYIQSLEEKIAIVVGIETHICVLQTCLDLLELGIQPVIVTDCVGSRKENDTKVAIKRLIQAGVIPTTSESLLFELCQCAKDPMFKEISKLVK